MICYKLIIAYDGSNYSGWQCQSNALTIQELVQNALAKFLKKEKVTLIGSGRTDAGVHAKAQVAHFHYAEPVDLNLMVMALNGILPKDIRIKQAEKASQHFHARYSAIGKEYHYYLYLDRVVDPFRRLYCWHMYYPLDRALLTQAANQFIGTHDFTSFANEAHRGASAINPIRTIYRIDICEEPQGLRLEFEGNGFLYKMVRNIVGMMIDVAIHKRPLENIQEIFAAKNRQLSSKAAPAQGLFLAEVKYPVKGDPGQ